MRSRATQRDIDRRFQPSFPAAGAVLFVLGLALGLGGAAGFAAPVDPPSSEPITDPAQVWSLSTESRAARHPLRIEGRLNYYDPMWGLCWIECNGTSTYLHLSSRAPEARTGQRVVFEGTIVPSRGLAADSAKATVLRDYEPIEPTPANGKIRDADALGGRVVTADAYVDAQQLIDNDHLRLLLIIDNRPVIGWVKPDNPRALPDWQGRFVRVMGVYSGRFDPTMTETSIELWIGPERDLTVLGSAATDPDFDLPTTPINEIYRAQPGRLIHVRGQVQAQDAGASLVVRDDTGQVSVRTVQQQRVPLGTVVDAIGVVVNSGARWVLQSGLFRPARPPRATERRPPAGPAVLETVDQIRQLPLEELARGRPVSISGMVLWALPGVDYFFLQDLTGAIRVRFSPDQMETPQLQQALAIEGVTSVVDFDPAVEMRSHRDVGSMTAPSPRRVSFDRAITGAVDGQWVELRGFFQRAEAEGERCRIYVTTPSGEFVALLQSPVNFTANPGSLIHVSGVCETTVNAEGRVTGLTLLVPFLHSFTIEEDAPRDLYDLPVRPIKELASLAASQDMIRARVSGVVQNAETGRLAYVDDGTGAVLVLSRETTPLAPGDMIEAVGILGREGARTVLREAVYRKMGSGPVPTPRRLDQPARLSEAFDARLVRVRGTLIDALLRPESTRLTLQAGEILFEAVLDRAVGAPLAARLNPGAVVDLTGLYRIALDDARQPRGFQLQLRSPGDIALIQPARFWTAERALLVAAVLAACLLLGVGWIAALRRQVARQTAQIRSQLERQAHLEAEVQRAARLESLGVLAGGIAHDFNNMLTVVIGNVSLALLDEKVAEAAGMFLQDIARAAHRARDLTQQLLTFAKGGEPLRRTLNLVESIHGAVEAVAPGPGVQVEVEVPPELWSAAVDRDQVGQTFRNILTNAIEAMPSGGRLRISLDNEAVSLGTPLPLAPGRYVRVTITDSGVGIAPDILPRIFDPYFSTKKTGGGLGLATVYSIVKRHQGHIEVQSAPGRGTTFTLWLPAAEPAPSAPPIAMAAAGAAAPPAPPARVLLMDDEETIRLLGTRLLERMGMQAIAVPDGAAAVNEFARARESGHPFDLLILDLTVPGGMGGKDTIAALRQIDARVPAIVSSGYSSDPVMAEYQKYGFQAMVPKPYEVAVLSDTIGRLLGPRPGGAPPG